MVAVHSLVAEVLADFINALETADDEAFQIELGCDAHVHVNVECVEMGDERTGACSAGDALKGRGLNLGVACLVEHAAKGAEHGGALKENVLDAVVDNEVNIALAVAELRIFEGVVCLAVFHLDDWKWAQRLAEHLDVLGVNGDFAHLCAEHKSLDADNVADVEQFLEENVVGVLVFSRTKVVAADVNLDTAFGVLQFHKRGFAHDAAAHDAAGNSHFAWLGVVFEVFLNLFCVSCNYIFLSGIRLYSHLSEFGETVASHNLLFA